MYDFMLTLLNFEVVLTFRFWGILLDQLASANEGMHGHWLVEYIGNLLLDGQNVIYQARI